MILSAPASAASLRPQHYTATANYIDRGAELTAALERADRLKRQHHEAQVRGYPDRDRLAEEYETAVTVASILREAEASGFVRGLRLAMTVYESQVRFHLGLDDILERIDALETAVVHLENGVRV